MFNVGDKVRFGRGQLVEVIGVDNDNYRIRLSNGREMTVVHERVHRDYPSHSTNLATNRKLSLNYYPSYFYEIYDDVMSGKLDLFPDYQRGIVWGDDERKELIESLLMNADIGKIVLVYINDSTYFENGKAWEVLDGVNRITTIVDYINNKFSVNGYYFDDLDRNDRQAIEGHTIGVAKIDELSMYDKLKLFLLLNRGGKPVSEEHINKVREMLEEC